MHPLPQSGRRTGLFVAGWLAALLGFVTGCASRQPRIAVIPRTEGTLLWESEHVGAEYAAHRTGASIYWIAPTREDDVEGQIALVERMAGGRFQGMVLAPDQALSLISPVRRVLARGIPTVIIGSPLPLPPGANLSYILNDDEAAGRLAAERIGTLLHGRGTVAVLGMTPEVTGIMMRERSFEQTLADRFPQISVVEKHFGLLNVPHEQQLAEETLRAHPDLSGVLALTSSSLDGTLSALDSVQHSGAVHVVGFDYAGMPPPFDRYRGLDCVIQEDTRSMGERAIDLIQARRSGASVPDVIRIPPTVITAANLNSAPVRRMLAQDWTLGRWNWSPTQ
jgi:ribose transport system substrate-binding protein